MSSGNPRENSKPCPNTPKGARCPLCGGSYVCLQSWRRKQESRKGGKP